MVTGLLINNQRHYSYGGINRCGNDDVPKWGDRRVPVCPPACLPRGILKRTRPIGRGCPGAAVLERRSPTRSSPPPPPSSHSHPLSLAPGFAFEGWRADKTEEPHRPLRNNTVLTLVFFFAPCRPSGAWDGTGESCPCVCYCCWRSVAAPTKACGSGGRTTG